jgi:hypothetical protein
MPASSLWATCARPARVQTPVVKLPLSPLLTAALFVTPAASSLACGGAETTRDGASAVTTDAAACPAPASASSDPSANCAAYCGYLACAGCSGGAEACTALCQHSITSADFNAACLMCAVNNEPAIAGYVHCDSFSTPTADGGATFDLEFSLAACGTVCPAPPLGD